MADIFTKAKRSQVMSRIRSRGNRATELALIRVFRAHQITGWRRHQPVFGKPDFVFPKLRAAVFVDGCFWHGCPLHATKPKNNAAFWRKKLAANQARDRLVTRLACAADLGTRTGPEERSKAVAANSAGTGMTSCRSCKA